MQECSQVSPAKKHIPYPGYAALKPLYPAFRSLRRVAGLQDTLINLGEVALRYFERDIAERPDEQSFVNKSAVDLDVNTTFGAPWDQVRLNAHRYAIAQAYAVFDTFCRQLGSEFRRYHPDLKWVAKEDGRQLDPLAALTASMSAANRKLARACPEYDLLHYYREVRNRVLHATEENTDELLARVLAVHSEHILRAYGSLPSKFSTIGYADYAVLTRALKYFAAILNDGCDLSVGRIVAHLLSTDDFVARARRRKGDQPKLRTLAESIRQRYGLKSDAELEILDHLSAFLVVDPTHKVRRREGGSRRRKTGS